MLRPLLHVRTTQHVPDALCTHLRLHLRGDPRPSYPLEVASVSTTSENGNVRPRLASRGRRRGIKRRKLVKLSLALLVRRIAARTYRGTAAAAAAIAASYLQ
jgi:hypothetical protein